MKCLSCSRSAKFQIPNNPKIVFCDKICQFDYVNGKREREEESFYMDDVVLKEFLLRVDPLTLIDSELVNKKYNKMIFNIYFMEQYVKLHEIPDEFMWWVYTKTRSKNWLYPNVDKLQFEHIVNSKYEGFFKDPRRSSNSYFLEACGSRGNVELVRIILKYNTNVSIINAGLQSAVAQSNLALFNLLLPKIEMDNNIASMLIDIMVIQKDPDRYLTNKNIFLKIYDYCSNRTLDKIVFYFMESKDILKIIFDKIPVIDEHLAEIIYCLPRESHAFYFTRILHFGIPKDIPSTLNAISMGFSSQTVYEILKDKNLISK
jgi:hypothetical protein